MGILEIARKEVMSVSPSDSIFEAATKMSTENVGSVVVTENNSPIGILTDRDIAIKVIAENNE